MAVRRKKNPFPIEAVLSDHAVLKDLDDLVTAQCDRDELLAYLSMANFVDESWKKLVGAGLKTYRRNIREIEHCANLIERLNRSKLLWLSISHPDPKFVGIHRSPTLPEQLRRYADNLRNLPETFGPKRSLGRHAWKALIVAKVTKVTGKPHDREVSALIAAVLDNRRYGVKAHQAWRRKYEELIRNMRDTVSERHLMSLPPPPSV